MELTPKGEGAYDANLDRRLARKAKTNRGRIRECSLWFFVSKHAMKIDFSSTIKKVILQRNSIMR
jgi:hypothetical protein